MKENFHFSFRLPRCVRSSPSAQTLSMKLIKVSKFTLAMVKALQETPTKDLGTEFEFLTRFYLTKELEEIIPLVYYAIYFSNLIRYVNELFILRALVPEVAKEAGFPDLVVENTPVMKEYDYEYLVYVGDTPPEIIKEYHKDPAKWIQAFAKVAHRTGTLPLFEEMTSCRLGLEYDKTFDQYAFCALLNVDPSEEVWERFFRAEGTSAFLEKIILEKQARYQKLPLVAVDFGTKVVDELPVIEIHCLPSFSGELIMIVESEVKTNLDFLETELSKIITQKFVDPSLPRFSDPS